MFFNVDWMKNVFGISWWDISGIYAMNMEAYYYYHNDYPFEDVKLMFDEGTVSTLDEATGLVTIRNTYLGTLDNPYAGTYLVNKDQEKTFPVDASIILPEGWSKIDEVISNDENAPVVYYNLQGQRVNNPSNGVFIRQQGKNVTKVLK